MAQKFLKDDITVNVAINLLKDKIYEKFLFVNGKKIDTIDN